mgnify:CR=1 FL=1
MGNTNGEKVRAIIAEWKNISVEDAGPELFAQVAINVLVDWDKRNDESVL